MCVLLEAMPAACQAYPSSMNKDTDTHYAGQRVQQRPNKRHKMLQANVLISVLNVKINLGLVVRILN